MATPRCEKRIGKKRCKNMAEYGFHFCGPHASEEALAQPVTVKKLSPAELEEYLAKR